VSSNKQSFEGARLYLSRAERVLILGRHDFYVEQVKSKVFPAFEDIEREAEQYSRDEYDRLGSLSSDDEVGMDIIAEVAGERGVERHQLLHDLKKRVILGAVAGLFHQWEKDLRGFIEHELNNDMPPDATHIQAWERNIQGVLDLIANFGWDCRASVFWLELEACRLIVNAYKHGKGPALEELSRRHPQYLDRGVTGEFAPNFAARFINHEWLSISRSQFESLAGALRAFWSEFPERLNYAPTTSQ
jgi:hypothetical protein